jgi:two-component system, NtrC family, sensor histidine kinase HydH
MSLKFKLRIQDVLLTAMFGALVILAHDISERSFILGLAALQLVEGRIPFLTTLRGRTISVVLQIIIVWVLIGYTHGLSSRYYLMLLLPLLSTASFLGLAGTVAASIAAIGAYLSFFLYVDFKEYYVDPEDFHTLAIRCLTLAIAAVLVNTLAAAIRAQSAKYKLIAEQLTVAEAAVRRSERLAALGQLSAGLAHELRNPLGSIKGSADLLARSASHNDPMAKELAGIISAEVDRTNSLVTRFLDFARPLEPRRESTDVTGVIDRAVVRAKVDAVRDYSPSLPRLAIDPELMEQVFLNLVTNASQASAPGAPITIRTREVDDQAEVSVIDHGCGIPPDKIETIFNPFVTTKQGGVGLGLAIVAKIVDGHGGKMSVESELGKGSTFRVLLPIPSIT